MEFSEKSLSFTAVQSLWGSIGMITDAAHANEIITGVDAALVFAARELLRQPYWALGAEQALGTDPRWPTQCGYAFCRRAK